MDHRLDGVLRVAQEQEQAQQMMMAALQATLQNPHTIHRHRIHIIAVKVDGPTRTLQIATPNGDRIDIEMAKQTAGQVAAGLLVPDPEVSS